MRAKLLWCAAPLYLLAACQQSGPVSDQANKSSGLAAPADSKTSDPTGAAPPPNSDDPPVPAMGSAPAATAAIPAALHWRWGMTPADCTSTRGDNKGLLTVSAGELRFYESRAVPTGNVQSSVDSFSADFSFTGEGMAWKKFETLKVEGNQLVRTESGPMASYTYVRCG